MLGKNSTGLVLPFLLPITACGSATATLPDGANPAHCIAAFSEVRYVALKAKPPALWLAVQMTGRGIFEGKKMQDAGNFQKLQSESEEFLKKFGPDSKTMDQLFKQCASRQDNDPAFRSLNKNGELMNVAKKADTACQADAACRASIK